MQECSQTQGFAPLDPGFGSAGRQSRPAGGRPGDHNGPARGIHHQTERRPTRLRLGVIARRYQDYLQDCRRSDDLALSLRRCDQIQTLIEDGARGRQAKTANFGAGCTKTKRYEKLKPRLCLSADGVSGDPGGAEHVARRRVCRCSLS